ncbi:YkvA family protein [uncultured Salegentibacter sp.]|uniref:YkvA family protein n=1 Tax=uncultured Salegentibacter sp. TaxID=259320 RepID=UPI00259748C8|nr:YkvA family protein [uncultured Salegentibacter sp.]
MSKIDDETIKQEHQKRQENFEEEDVQGVLEDEEEIKSKFESKGKLQRYVDDAQLLFNLLRDYASGNYREVPFNVVAAIGGALLYVLSPLDLIPDFIPIVGYLDDAAVIAFCLNLIEKDLITYKVWKAERA